MKRIIGLAFVLILGYVIFTGLYGIDGFPLYGQADLEGRVSSGFINKNVTGDEELVEYRKSSGLETGSANLVTSIIVNYRSFDTLGEVTVLFVSALGVSILFGALGGRIKRLVPENRILKTGAKIAFPLILVTGIYIFTHGHLSPGGGFPGGSMIASAILLMYLSDESFRIRISGFKMTESIAGSLYVVVGLSGLALAGYFLGNILGTGTVGTLLSGGIIPVVYVLIGLKVGSELTGIVTDFMKEGVADQ